MFVADTGVGKSWTINLMLLLSCTDPATYKSDENRKLRETLKIKHYEGHPYYLEALQAHSSKAKPPGMIILDDEAKKAIQSCGLKDHDLRRRTDALKVWCEGENRLETDPADMEQGESIMPGYLLPTKNHLGTTTPYSLCISHGHTWHFSYEVKPLKRAAELVREHLQILLGVRKPAATVGLVTRPRCLRL